MADEFNGEQASSGRTVDADTLDVDSRTALAVVEELCAASGIAAHIVVHSVRLPYISIEIQGEDARNLWGRSGHVLDALQLICNAIAGRRTAGEIRIQLDADGYRERRAEVLRQRAQELADEVKERNEECELEPLPPHERRIIHSALADNPFVSTYSEGDEPARRVVIAPKR